MLLKSGASIRGSGWLRKAWRRAVAGDGAVLLAYLALTLAYTWPLAVNFTRAIPGDGFDGWQNFWNLWWVRTALLEQHTSPFFTGLLYAPTGVGLLFHTLNPFNGLLALPVQLAAGLFPAYNGIVLFSFTLGGYGAYLLARHVLGPQRSRLPACIAGLIFTFSPFHVAHLLGHMQVISLEWIPFFALYLLRAVNLANRKSQIANRKDVLLAAFFLVLVALCDWYYVLYCLIFTGLAVIWAAWRSARAGRAAPPPPRSSPSAPLLPRPSAPLLQAVAAPAAIWLLWAIALSPLLAPMVGEARQFRFMAPDPAQSRTLSADLLAFVTPQEFHPLWGRWAAERAASFTASVSEHSVFAGFTALALAALGSIRRHKAVAVTGRRSSVAAFAAGFWWLALGAAVVLALGPVLHIGGRSDLLPGGREIPLPYGPLVQAIPFMDITRSVSRFAALVMLALAVLAARGAAVLVQRPRRGRLLAAIAAGLILCEFLPAPYPLSLPDTPAWYRTLAADPRPGTLLNLPMNWDRPGYLLYQTEHAKPLSVAYISRDDPRTLTERAPVLQHLRHLRPDVIEFDLARQGQQVLADLGIRWVVLDRYKMPSGHEREYTDWAAGQIFAGQAPVYGDERLTVYEVTPPPATAPYLVLGLGWGAFDRQAGVRSFTGQAPLTVQAPAAGNTTLRVTLAPGSAPLAWPPDTDGSYRVALNLRAGANEFALTAAQADGIVIVKELALAR